ncbi:hypothetical protein JVT61DRAFT_14861 [Boletus reticuloceps]|uniref:Uncharacterized protein n=1 Tax=Boletus reticuloceps TaxID=495285 RepID=A0A8I3A2A4_9AGAM|nr:hypothetical protein JVT61DRAFT_14861 [Boletus reticuloceps]
MPHRVQRGFTLCNHTCQRRQCKTRHGRILWAKEGSSAMRHSKNKKLHPGCKFPCPVAVNEDYTRNSTEEDHAVEIRTMVLAGSSSKAIDDTFSKRIPKWNVGLVNWRLLVTQRSVCGHD